MMMRLFLSLTAVLLLTAACTGRADTPETATEAVTEPAVSPSMPLDDLGAAPEITNQVWINADAPITLASQRGKVVLLEFWTFGCINCKRTIPFINDWYATYAGDDFTVLSVHYPEFAYEADVDNVRTATADLGIAYPVAIDNDRVTWAAYNQRFWPTTYLIDKNGRIRLQHIGEYTRGADAELEAAIETLMAEPDPAP